MFCAAVFYSCPPKSKHYSAISSGIHNEITALPSLCGLFVVHVTSQLNQMSA